MKAIRIDNRNAACTEPDNYSAYVDAVGLPLCKRGNKGDLSWRSEYLLLLNQASHKGRGAQVQSYECYGLVAVVETASDNHQLSVGCPVHQSVRLIDAPGPVAG